MKGIAGEAPKGIAGEFVRPLVQRLVDPLINEAHYFCCFSSYVKNFEKKKNILAAKQEDVKIEIGKASGVSRVKKETMQWADEADNLIKVGTKTKEKWCLGVCPNCIWQYRKGKELAEKTEEIQDLLGRCSSKIVAGPADVLDMKYHSLSHFIHFGSREMKFQELMKALEDEDCNLIGLHGMGGLGKTSLATEVGAKLEGSKFDKVILLVVSKPPDYKKIQGEIARRLDLTLKEGTEEEHSKAIWSKITNMKEKLLIILDDVWEAFDLKKVLGIPFGDQHKGCSVLITTRNVHVCSRMGCQKKTHLETLTDKEALDLLLEYAGIPNSPSFNDTAQNIVKHCGGVLVAIVAVARTLKDRPLGVWEKALKTLQNTKSLLNVDEDLTDVYKCLKLSYDNLKNETIRELFLICSLFPEDFEIPIEALGRIGIGVGLWGDVENYYTVRSKVLDAVQELLDSCLLFNARREHVKMHDLVREVALWIASKDIQLITDCEMPIHGDLRYSFWKIEKFPNKFDGMKVEILLTYVDGSNDLNVPDTLFAKMTRLKVLFLYNTRDDQIFSSPSFLYSLQSLKDIRVLTLGNLILGDICTLGNFTSLESLQLDSCSIMELPREFMKLMKLRVLDIQECEIEMNNPFEVIERCSQLEELTFIKNRYKKERKDLVSPILSLPTLHRYQISPVGLSDYFGKYSSRSRCLQPDDHLRHLISEATFKQLVAKAELLMLSWYKETGWKNIIPDIVPINGGGMNDLDFLYLASWPEIQCLINAMNHHSDVIAFNNLVELHLYEMDVEVLYQGPLPSSFLVRLQIMTLRNCQKLSNILIKGKLSLRHLKAMELGNCPLLTSIFESSTAKTLEQLEELTIISCNALECIITNKSSGNETAGDDGDNDQKSNGSLFPKLKVLRIEGCDKLEIILPPCFIGKFPPLEVINVCKCENLKYIFEKFQEEDHVMLPSSKEMKLSKVPNLISIYREPISSSSQRPSSLVSRNKSKEKLPSPDTSDFPWAQLCCFLHKSGTTIEETNVAASAEGPLDHTFPLELHVSKKWFETTDMLIRQLLSFRHVKKMNFTNLSLKSASLFTLSVASNILWEELIIRECVGMKSIIAGDDADDYNDQMDNTSIFPKLQELEIGNCKDLEFLFLCTISVGIKNLKSLTIEDAPKLNYVVGKYHHKDQLSNQSRSDALQFHLPALETLCLQDVQTLIIKYFIDLMACSDEGQQNQNITKPTLLENLTIKRCHQLKCIGVEEEDVQVPTNYSSIFSKLKNLEIEDCRELEFLFPPSLSIELKNLESLTIIKAPKLKYVIGKCQREDHLSNDSQNDELHFHLPALQYLCFEDLPKMISICAMSYFLEWPSIQRVHLENCSIKSFAHLMASSNEQHLNWKTTKEIHGVPPFQAAQSLITQSLSNIWEMELFNCSNLISLFTLQAASTIVLEHLIIEKCDKLKCIVADEGDAQVPMNYCSIFPKLEYLTIRHCKELEFLFPSSLSLQLKNLRSLTIEDALELKFVIGKYQHEDLLSTQNQHDELHFDLPALEYLYLQDVPKMINICVMKYSLRNCGIRSFTDLMVCSNEEHLNRKTTKELDASMNAIPPFQVTQSLLTQSLSNIKKMTLCNYSNIISLLTLPTASMFQLEDLSIESCQELKCIVAEEGDVPAHTNQDSIFLKLKTLHIVECDALEYLFPTSIFRSIMHLQSLHIHNSPQLKYVFGRSHHEDNLSHENHNIQTYIEFPALEELVLWDVPNLVSICPKNYYLRGLSLMSIELKTSPEFTVRSTTDFMVFEIVRQQDSTTVKEIEMHMQTLTHLKVSDTKIEEIFNLTYLDVEKNGERLAPLTSSLQELKLEDLSELRNICVGPKYILSLNNLMDLEITTCTKLKVVFSASILQSLPKLESLGISNCGELVHIIEEDNEENVGNNLRHEPCFPNLSQLRIDSCNNLKYLFCISMSGFLPKLSNLSIEDSSNLEHVLTRQDDAKEMIMKDVLPELSDLKLGNLPNLISVCHGIDFRKLEKYSEVIDCPIFSFYETTTTQLSDGSKNLDPKVTRKAEQKFSSHVNTDPSTTGEANGRRGLKIQQSTINSPNCTRATKETTEEIVEEDDISKMPKMTNASSDSKFTGQLKNKAIRYTSASEITDSQNVSANIIEERAEGVSLETLYPSSLTSKTVPTSKSHNLTDLRVGDNNPMTTKILEEGEKEEGDPMSLNASTNLKQMPFSIPSKPSYVEVPSTEGVSSTTYSSSLTSKKVPIAMSHNLTVLPIEDNSTPTIAQTFEVKEQGDPMLLEVSVSFKQTYSSKPAHGRNIPSGVETTINQQTHQATDTIKSSGESGAHAIAPSRSGNVVSIPHTTTLFEADNNEEINEASVVRNKSTEKTASHGDQTSETNEEEGYSAAQESSNSEKIETTNQITDSKPRKAIPTTPYASSMDQLVGKEVRKETIVMDPELLQETRPDFQSHESTNIIQVRAKGVSSGDINSSFFTSKTTTQIPVNSNLNILPAEVSTNTTTKIFEFQEEEEGKNVQEGVGTTNQSLREAMDTVQATSQLVEHDAHEILPSFCETNTALTVSGVQEIVAMMKLEGVEPSMLAEAFKIHPQLCLSTKDRSTRMLCMSYRVLLDILNILATRTPFTITEEDQKLLVENLKDASLLGFDKGWLESIKTKVFDCDTSDVHHMQEVLKDLGDKLKTKKIELANVRDQETKAAQAIEVAQKEFEAAQKELANFRLRHSQLSEECQDILERRDQCWETVATKFRHFGF